MYSSFEIPKIEISEQNRVVIEFKKLEIEISQIEDELATMDEQKEKILKKYLE